MFELTGINEWTAQALAIDFVIILALFVSLKWVKGAVSNVHANDEISKRDNSAFGLSFAAGLAGLAVVLSGVTAGAFARSLLDEAFLMAGYGVVGIALITLGRVFLDKVALKAVPLHKLISDGNMAAAITDLGHIVAVAIVIRSSMLWVATEGWLALPIVLAAFVIANALLLLVAHYQVWLYRKAIAAHDSLASALTAGCVAPAIHYAGFLIGVGLAITAASGLAPYAAEAIGHSLLAWAIAAIAAVVLFSLLHVLMLKVILMGVHIRDEINHQHNIGVASIAAASAFAIGLTMATLLGA